MARSQPTTTTAATVVRFWTMAKFAFIGRALFETTARFSIAQFQS